MALELDIQGLAAVAALAEARAAEKAAKDAAESAAKAVKALLGDEDAGTVAGVVVVKIVDAERKGLDAKGLRADLPEIADKYETVTQYQKVMLA